MGTARSAGFTVLEILVATAIIIVMSAAVFSMLRPSSSLVSMHGEAGDLQQRLRVAADTLFGELQQAGAGVSAGPDAGTLLGFFAPVLPHRHGGLGDPPGTYTDEAVSVMYAGSPRAQAALASPLDSRSGRVVLSRATPCPTGLSSCGFSDRMSVIVYDRGGSYSRFTVLSARADVLDLRHDSADSTKTYLPGSTIVAVESASYFVSADPLTGVMQFVRTTGDGGRRVPIVDHVSSVRFDYYADPRPPTMLRPVSQPRGPWTTYGPRPPDFGVRHGTYPAGENCAFVNDGSPMQASRLQTLAAPASTLVRLVASQVTDGPWCPDDESPDRFDADLLRVRAIEVAIRVESALASLRGPAGVLFSNAGTARGGEWFVPDLEARFRVSPRNLNLVN